MKKALYISFLTLLLVVTMTDIINAQPHTGSQNSGNVSGERIGANSSGAPIGDGTIILISLAGLYIAKKTYTRHKYTEG